MILVSTANLLLHGFAFFLLTSSLTNVKISSLLNSNFFQQLNYIIQNVFIKQTNKIMFIQLTNEHEDDMLKKSPNK